MVVFVWMNVLRHVILDQETVIKKLETVWIVLQGLGEINVKNNVIQTVILVKEIVKETEHAIIAMMDFMEKIVKNAQQLVKKVSVIKMVVSNAIIQTLLV
jgi:hypothetical protein